MSSPLAEIVRRQSALLDDLFGKDAYAIDETDPEECRVRTSWVEVQLICNWRDQCIDVALEPLKAPLEIRESHSAWLWFRFLDMDVASSHNCALDDHQVISELRRIRPILALLRDERRTTEALWFLRGYNSAYTDWSTVNRD